MRVAILEKGKIYSGHEGRDNAVAGERMQRIYDAHRHRDLRKGCYIGKDASAQY